MEINYVPKFYQCELIEIKQEARGSSFNFESVADGGSVCIHVDEPLQRIFEKMKDVLEGKRDEVYLSHGMSDVDLIHLSGSVWQLFDEYDVYEFEIKYQF